MSIVEFPNVTAIVFKDVGDVGSSQRCMYWRPVSTNFPTIDSVCPPTTFFQITAMSLHNQNDHPIDIDVLAQFVKKFNSGSVVDFVFIVPTRDSTIPRDISRMVPQRVKGRLSPSDTLDTWFTRLTNAEMWEIYCRVIRDPRPTKSPNTAFKAKYDGGDKENLQKALKELEEKENNVVGECMKLKSVSEFAIRQWVLLFPV